MPRDTTADCWCASTTRIRRRRRRNLRRTSCSTSSPSASRQTRYALCFCFVYLHNIMLVWLMYFGFKTYYYIAHLHNITNSFLTQVSHSSDHFAKLEEIARRMITEGKAYMVASDGSSAPSAALDSRLPKKESSADPAQAFLITFPLEFLKINETFSIAFVKISSKPS
jgi:hypothetical protein